MNPNWKLSLLFLPPAMPPLWPRPHSKNSYDPALSNRRETAHVHGGEARTI